MRRFPLSRNRDFMLLWGGEALSQLGSQATTVAFPLLVLALTGSPAKAGLVGLAKWVPLALAALPAGMVADRFDRKRLMVASDGARALLLASIPVALWLGSPPFLQIIGVAFGDGCLMTLRYVCERGVMRSVVKSDQLSDAVAQNEARMFAAGIIGPPLGGILFAAARALPFVADAVSYVVSTVMVAATRFQVPERVPVSDGRLGGIGDGLAWLWRAPFFRTMTLLFAAGNPLFTGLYLLAILLAKRHGASSAEVGVMFAIVGCGGLLGAFVAGPLRRGLSARVALAGASCLMAAALPFLFVVHAAVLIGLIVAVCEFPTPMANGLVSGSRVAVTPEHLQGRVQAAAVLVTMSLGWLGPLAVGFLFQHAGPATTVGVVAGWGGLLALANLLAPALHEGPPLALEAAMTGA